MKSEANKFISSSFVVVATRLAERSLGLVSTLIIARLLTPEDFGIVAIAMIAVSFFDILSKTGAQQYIVQKSSVDDCDINTAWTLNLLLKTILFLAIVIASPYIAEFYGDPRLEYVLVAISLMAPIHAVSNPGLFLHVRDQNYRTISLITLVKKLISVITTITFAFVYQNYWALIFGQLIGALVKATLSYIFVRYRPALNFKKFNEQWGFSKWMLMKEILGFLRSQSDMLIVGKFYSIDSMGGYHISKYISSMPTTELIQPALAPLLASFSRSKSNKEALIYQVELVFLVVSLLVVPMSIYLYFFSDQLVSVLLGDQWKRFSFIFGVLALVAISSEIVRIPSTIMTSMAKLRILFFYDLLSLLFVISVLLIFRDKTLEQFVVAKVVAEFTCGIIFFGCIGYILEELRKFFLLACVFSLIVILSIIAANVSLYLVSSLDSALIELMLSATMYFLLLLSVFIILYICGLKKNPHVIHIMFLVKAFANPILLKFRAQ